MAHRPLACCLARASTLRLPTRHCIQYDSAYLSGNGTARESLTPFSAHARSSFASSSTVSGSSRALFLGGGEGGSSDPDPALVNASHAPNGFEPSCAVVYRDVISQATANMLSQEILTRMKRRRYEKGHWDAVITLYKEVELSDISFPSKTADGNADDGEKDLTNEEIPYLFESIRQHLAERHLSSSCRPGSSSSSNEDGITWLPCHAIDLKKEGELKAHVDSVRFSGDLVAGLSLLSSSIMRLKIPKNDGNGDEEDDHDKDEGFVDLYLPPRSLYALTGVGRYRYAHELLPDGSVFVDDLACTETVVSRDHRLSIIFRDAKRE